RHAKILEILDQHAIETQEELAEKLKEKTLSLLEDVYIEEIS
ncbi:MAG TPA: arginine repressor, partial [Syntrophorhabdus aromaticivorans]|nr:arginine repressor [Syntrophorhabdus aromaticivorans]